MHHNKVYVLSKTVLKALRSASAGMDYNRAIAVLQKAIVNEEASMAVAAYFRNDDSLVVMHADIVREAKRTEFVSAIARWASASGWPLLGRSMVELAELHSMIETGYRLMSESLDEAFSGWAPELLISAALSYAAQNYEEIYARGPQFSGSTPQGVNPMSEVVVVLETGQTINVDAHTSLLTNGVANLVEFLGYRDWFTDNGMINLPPLPEPSQEQVRAAEQALILSTSWYRWSRWEREARYFDGDITAVSADGFTAEMREAGVITVLKYQRGAEVGRDWVAVQRLANQQRQNLIQWYVKSPALYAGPQATTLPPAQFFDPAEWLACALISEVGHLDVLDHTPLCGVTLSEWLRGYSVLKRIGQEALEGDGTQRQHLIILPRSKILNDLVTAGLSTPAALNFIDGTTFRKKATDLFDAPLLAMGEDQFLIFGPSVANLDAGRAVLSNLPALGAKLDYKGNRFEAHVIEFIRSTGLIVYAPPERKFDGEPIQIDALVHWGEFLFVLECKNVAPASLHPVTALNFQGEHAANQRQVKRLKALLLKHPQLLLDVGGPDPRELTLIPIILYSTPFSTKGPVDGVYTADFSMLTRFFGDPELGVEAAFPVSKTEHMIHRQITERIWKGDKPNALDFISALDDPWTIRFVEERTAKFQVPISLAPFVLGITDEFGTIDLDRAAIAEIYGINLAKWEAELAATEERASRRRDGLTKAGT